MTEITPTQSDTNKVAHGVAAAVVFLFPALTLVRHPADGVALGLLAVVGTWMAFRQRGSGYQPTREEKLLYFSVCGFFIAALFVIFSGDITGGINSSGVKILANYVPLLLVIPVYVFLRRVGVSLLALWSGLAVGVVMAAGITMLGVWGKLPGVGDAHSIVSPLVISSVTSSSVFLVFLIPAKLCIDILKRQKGADMRRLAIAGLLLIAGFIGFGFSGAILEYTQPISFFAFYLAVIFAAIQTQKQKARREPVKRQQSLSVIIIAQDEADRIEPCLQSVADWADEIIVLDSGSSDNTVEIARRYTDKVFETDWPGYGPQKQRALEKANCDWVLSIDADERVSPELRYDIDAALTANPECVGYRTPWAVMVYGHRMDFGRSARSPRRLFKREGARFTDAQVHEHVVLAPGKKGDLEGRLYHYTHRNYGHALQKSAKYAWLGGQKRFVAGKWGGGLPVAALRSLWNFILIYFLRLGFLDGPVGFVVAVTYAQGAFNKYGALWALRRESRFSEKG